MFTIIHGGHRHGYHWRVTTLLKESLEGQGIEVYVIDLSDKNFHFCCGSQICQESECIYKDDIFSKVYKKEILASEGVYIISPTYFNMPTAKLKNFMDRSNALLPLLEKSGKNVIFGVWVSGEAEKESIECNKQLLIDYAEIMGWKVVKEMNQVVCLNEEGIESKRVKEIADIVSKIME